MSRPRWMSAISAHRPPVPTTAHWTTSLIVSAAILAGASWLIAARSLPEPIEDGEEVESVIVSLGAPAQRLEPPPPPPPDAPPPEPAPEPQVPTERAEDAPPPEPPPQPRPVLPAAPADGRLSSGFGAGTGPPAPAAPPPQIIELRWDFKDYSARQYISRVRYPREALRRQIQGRGKLEVTIDQSGRILGHEIIQSTGSHILDREIERVAGEVERLDPLPDYYTRSTATLIVPFAFILDRPR